MVVLGASLGASTGQERPGGQAFTFRTGVQLVNVTVTVTDENGRFVPNLRAEDFVLSEDGQPQQISQFEAERVPVSLGIALDTSGSMLGEKIVAAQTALHRFLFDLLGPQDEVFLYRFDSRPDLIQGWTPDRAAVSRVLGSVRPSGGTALYDTVAESVPLAQSGSRRKKALVIISDGNDTSSHIYVGELQQIIRNSEVLVYAIGIDSGSGSGGSAQPPQTSSTSPQGGSSSGSNSGKTIPVPSPFPGKGPSRQPAPATTAPPPPPPPPQPPANVRHTGRGSSDRVNVEALRAITDDSGGRTEIIFSARDLDPATAGIADELSRQYFLAYSSNAPKDGKWHTIDVQIKKGKYTVRARKGFIAS
jgi:VWFA-related protein